MLPSMASESERPFFHYEGDIYTYRKQYFLEHLCVVLLSFYLDLESKNIAVGKFIRCNIFSVGVSLLD